MSGNAREQHVQRRATVFDLLRLLGRQRLPYLISMLALAATQTLERLFTAWLCVSVTRALTAGDVSSLIHTLVISAFFYPAYSALTPLSFVPWQMSIQSGLAGLRQQLFARLQRLPMAEHEKRHTGDAQSLLSNDVTALDETYNRHFWGIVQSSVQGISAITVMMLLDWRMALVSLGAGFGLVTLNAAFAGPLRKVGRIVQANLVQVTERLSDLLSGAEVLRAFNLGQLIRERFGAANDSVRGAAVRRARAEGFVSAANSMMFSVIFVPVGVGAYLMLDGRVEFSTVMGIVQLSSSALIMLMTLGSAFSRFQAALAAADRIVAVLETAPEADAPVAPAVGSATVPAPASTPALSLTDVGFAYADSAPVLSELTFAVAPGRMVALVGPSGGGKSTILKLLLGFHRVTAGSISLGGQPLAAYPLSELRRQFAYVPQDAYLFAESVAENIRLGRPGATDAEVRAAAVAANADEFISRLPAGYDTPVGERGSQLSGGQRQRIAIARAILRNAPILLLDEATSALDAESEELVQQALEKLMVGRTTLVVAHRLSTIERADEILVIEGGRLTERGDHAQLMVREGAYRRLHDTALKDAGGEAGRPAMVAGQA